MNAGYLLFADRIDYMLYSHAITHPAEVHGVTSFYAITFYWGSWCYLFLQMMYAELLWVDRLGLYISCESEGGKSKVVRVPFIRPVLDERDARCVPWDLADLWGISPDLLLILMRQEYAMHLDDRIPYILLGNSFMYEGLIRASFFAGLLSLWPHRLHGRRRGLTRLHLPQLLWLQPITKRERNNHLIIAPKIKWTIHCVS
jgi:hypothetical protein